MRRVVSHKIEVIRLVIYPTLKCLIQYQHTPICDFCVLGHELIKVRRDYFLSLAQNGDWVWREDSRIVEQVYHPIHEKHKEGEKVE